MNLDCICSLLIELVGVGVPLEVLFDLKVQSGNPTLWKFIMPLESELQMWAYGMQCIFGIFQVKFIMHKSCDLPRSWGWGLAKDHF